MFQARLSASQCAASSYHMFILLFSGQKLYVNIQIEILRKIETLQGNHNKYCIQMSS